MHHIWLDIYERSNDGPILYRQRACVVSPWCVRYNSLSTIGMRYIIMQCSGSCYNLSLWLALLTTVLAATVTEAWAALQCARLNQSCSMSQLLTGCTILTKYRRFSSKKTDCSFEHYFWGEKISNPSRAWIRNNL